MPVKPEDYDVKVLLGLPFAGRYVPPLYAVTLAAFCWPMNVKHVMYPVIGRPREQAREDIIEKARELKARFVLMLDDDVVPPADGPMLLVRELEQHLEFDVIAGIVTSKHRNGEPMVFKGTDGGPYWRWKLGEVFEVDEIATAFMLIRTSLFDTLPKPWFRDLNTVEEQKEAGVLGEPKNVNDIVHKAEMSDDIFFCKKAKRAGHRILAHGAIICAHYDQEGNRFEMPQDSYPFWPNVPHIMDIRDALRIEGWMSAQELAWLAQWAKQSPRIAEIGCWRGRSTKCLAQNTKGTVTAIDTWAGDALDGRAPKIQSTMPKEYLFEEFLRNVEENANVTVLRSTSLDAAEQLTREGARFDMIFIDANHDYDAVRADIEAWLPLLAPGGLMCGHDYLAVDNQGNQDIFPGVTQAVRELLPDALVAEESIWMWQAPAAQELGQHSEMNAIEAIVDDASRRA